MHTRRQFLRYMTGMAGTLVVFPTIYSCTPTSGTILNNIPFTKPENWDPIAYNRKRGNAGAIPNSYLPDINGPEGVKKHLGKHLPYLPEVDPAVAPGGFIPLMWGDPSLGYVRHPNAVPNKDNNHEGHWYNWIKIRKATPMWAKTAESTYVNWPEAKDPSTGAYAVYGGGDIEEDSGKNTIYLAKLPPDVEPGDQVRIWAHCLRHGEYIDFITLS